MPAVRKRSEEPVAVLTADWHLSHAAPTARSVEPDWYEAMRRNVRFVFDLADDLNVPILHAGDLFDRWNSPPELINFCLEEFGRCGGIKPLMYAVPGQHDLPHHSYENIDRSAFNTLVRAGLVNDVTGDVFGIAYVGRRPRLRIVGVPWGGYGDQGMIGGPKPDCLNVLLIHSYCWTTGTGHVGAAKEDGVLARRKGLAGYDVAVFGDNHRAFRTQCGDTNVVNCGCLMQRKSDEIGYKPGVWILRADGSAEKRKTPTSLDRWVEDEEVPETGTSTSAALEEALAELKGLDVDSLDFREAVLRHMNDNRVSEGVRFEVLAAMGEEEP